MKICVRNKAILLWLALTFVSFLCRSALRTGKDRCLFDRFWQSDSRVESDIFPAFWHSSCCALSFIPSWYSAKSLFIIYFSESLLKFKKWDAGRCCLTSHFASWWILLWSLIVRNCTANQSLDVMRWFSKYCSNPKFWYKKTLTNFLSIYNRNSNK